LLVLALVGVKLKLESVVSQDAL